MFKTANTCSISWLSPYATDKNIFSLLYLTMTLANWVILATNFIQAFAFTFIDSYWSMIKFGLVFLWLIACASKVVLRTTAPNHFELMPSNLSSTLIVSTCYLTYMTSTMDCWCISPSYLSAHVPPRTALRQNFAPHCLCKVSLCCRGFFIICISYLYNNARIFDEWHDAI